MKIVLPICSLERQKVTTEVESYLVLENDFLEFKLEFQAEVKDDDTEIWRPENAFLNFFTAREKVVGVELAWLEDAKRWKITILVMPDNEIKIYFKKRTDAEPVFEKVTNYILGKPYSPVKPDNIFL